jgi:hypothetical protein
MAMNHMIQSIRILPKIGISCRDAYEKILGRTKKIYAAWFMLLKSCKMMKCKNTNQKMREKKISVTLELNKQQCQLSDFQQTKIEFHFLWRFSVSFFILFSNISVSERVRRLLCPRVIPAWILFYLADLDYSKNICR